MCMAVWMIFFINFSCEYDAVGGSYMNPRLMYKWLYPNTSFTILDQSVYFLFKSIVKEVPSWCYLDKMLSFL